METSWKLGFPADHSSGLEHSQSGMSSSGFFANYHWKLNLRYGSKALDSSLPSLYNTTIVALAGLASQNP